MPAHGHIGRGEAEGPTFIKPWNEDLNIVCTAFFPMWVCTLKGDSKVRFFGQGGACNSAPIRPIDLKFCMWGSLGGYIWFLLKSRSHDLYRDQTWSSLQMWLAMDQNQDPSSTMVSFFSAYTFHLWPKHEMTKIWTFKPKISNQNMTKLAKYIGIQLKIWEKTWLLALNSLKNG